MISSVNVTTLIADLVTFTEEILNGKLHFLCSVKQTYILYTLENNLLNMYQQVFVVFTADRLLKLLIGTFLTDVNRAIHGKAKK